MLQEELDDGTGVEISLEKRPLTSGSDPTYACKLNPTVVDGKLVEKRDPTRPESVIKLTQDELANLIKPDQMKKFYATPEVQPINEAQPINERPTDGKIEGTDKVGEPTINPQGYNEHLAKVRRACREECLKQFCAKCPVSIRKHCFGEPADRQGYYPKPTSHTFKSPRMDVHKQCDKNPDTWHQQCTHECTTYATLLPGQWFRMPIGGIGDRTNRALLAEAEKEAGYNVKYQPGTSYEKVKPGFTDVTQVAKNEYDAQKRQNDDAAVNHGTHKAADVGFNCLNDDPKQCSEYVIRMLNARYATEAEEEAQKHDWIADHPSAIGMYNATDIVDKNPIYPAGTPSFEQYYIPVGNDYAALDAKRTERDAALKATLQDAKGGVFLAFVPRA